MGEFIYMEEWDLQAVVRGSTGVGEVFSYAMDPRETSPFSPLIVQQETFLFETETENLDELRGLYKPFYPLSPQTILASSISVPEESKCSQEMRHQHFLSPKPEAKRISEAKLKKSKKNQQKRVVKQVEEEGLSSDIWAWRKYGQKPIKGSPYPRSYYRCSSSKGCLARRQVERNPLNPDIFIVTYTNEHSHGQPSKRNSLAGSTRSNKSVTRKNSPRNEPKNQMVASPTSNRSSTTPVEDYLAQNKSLNQEETQQMIRDFEGIIDALSPDMMLGTELFPSLGHLDEWLTNKDFDFDGCFFD